MLKYSDLAINIIGAFLILITGLILAQIISNLLKKLIRGTEVNKALEEQLKLKFPIDTYVSSICKYLIYFTTIILVLNKIGVSTRILQIILIIIVIVIIIFIILAFKDWLPNILSGFYILKTEKIKINEFIKINGLKGRVIGINLLETKIETDNNEIVFIPNANITKFEVRKEK